MARTYVQPGDVLTLTAPTGGVTAGTPVFVNGLFVIPQETVAQTLPFDGYVTGVHALTKTDSQAWLEGQSIFWDLANSCATDDPTAGPFIGFAAAAVAVTAGLTTGYVSLAGRPATGGVFNIRKRFTVAQVNAGATILPARAGLQYRMVDAFAIAVGGAVGAVTTVDILATLSASSRKLVAFTQANMTQSTLLRAGGTGATILADGASFTTNDANTAVTILKNGSDITTASHIDVSFTYAIEA